MGEAGHDSTGREPSGAGAIRLSRAVARGDPSALAEFYECWFHRCFAAARAMTGRDEAFCLDVVQEAMLKVVRSIRPMRSEAELNSWMARVVRTTAIDMLRAERRRLARQGQVAMTETKASPSPALVAAAAEQARWVGAAMDGLAPRDRELLAVRLAGESTLDEAGAKVGISGGAAHGRIRRVLGRLRLAAMEVFDE